MEGTHLLLSLLWEAGYKVSRKKAQICQTLSNISPFICPRGNAGSILRGNRLCIQSQSLRPPSKLVNFGELRVSVESGYLTTPSWPNPSMKPQSRENRSL
jgi:hypothetical protein